MHEFAKYNRASRSLAKTVFFFKVLLALRFPRVSRFERSKLRFMLDFVLGGVLQASWNDLGRFLGGQDAPKTSQDSAKMGQEGARTGKMARKRP